MSKRYVWFDSIKGNCFNGGKQEFVKATPSEERRAKAIAKLYFNNTIKQLLGNKTIVKLFEKPWLFKQYKL